MITEPSKLLTESDKEYLSNLFSSDSQSTACWDSLLSDQSVLQLILDREDFRENLLDNPCVLHISSSFYFYVVVYWELKKRNITDNRLAVHISGLLDKFHHSQNLLSLSDQQGTRNIFPSVIDLLRDIAASPRHLAHARRISLADLMLFMTGVFHQLIEERKNRRAAPPLEFYEKVGSDQYCIVADDGLASDSDEAECFSQLGREFHQLRLALNDISDRIFHLHGFTIALPS